jgi:hypothetical protein
LGDISNFLIQKSDKEVEEITLKSKIHQTTKYASHKSPTNGDQFHDMNVMSMKNLASTKVLPDLKTKSIQFKNNNVGGRKSSTFDRIGHSPVNPSAANSGPSMNNNRQAMMQNKLVSKSKNIIDKQQPQPYANRMSYHQNGVTYNKAKQTDGSLRKAAMNIISSTSQPFDVKYGSTSKNHSQQDQLNRFNMNKSNQNNY